MLQKREREFALGDESCINKNYGTLSTGILSYTLFSKYRNWYVQKGNNYDK